MNLPVFETYCETYCENTTAANALRFDYGTASVWFSYETPVAFRTDRTGLVVRQNKWGPTTGKHLNAIDGGDEEAKSRRVDGPDFQALLEEVLD